MPKSDKKNRRLALLHDAYDALNLIDTAITVARHGDVDGIDVVAMGLRAIAPPLVELVSMPSSSGRTGLLLEDVAGYLVMQKRVSRSFATQLEELSSLIRSSSYSGIPEPSADRAELLRKGIYDGLADLLSAIEEELERS